MAMRGVVSDKEFDMNGTQCTPTQTSPVTVLLTNYQIGFVDQVAGMDGGAQGVA